MPTLDPRASRLDVTVHPGNAVSIVLDFPAALTGRSFTAAAGSIDGGATYSVTPTVTIDDDELVVSFTESQTLALAALGKFTSWWKLTETTGGGTQDLIVGQITVNEAGSGSVSTTATVTLTSETVAVTIVGADLAALYSYIDAQMEAIPVDADVDVPSLRTLGLGASQAMPGDRTFDDQYDPIKEIVLCPPNFGGPSSSTAPVPGNINFTSQDRWAALLFDGTTSTSWTYSPLMLPPHWETFDWGIAVTKHLSGTGNGRFRGDVAHVDLWTDGAVLDPGNGVLGTEQTLTAPPQKERKLLTLGTNIDHVVGHAYALKVNRIKGVNDTITNPLAVLWPWARRNT